MTDVVVRFRFWIAGAFLASYYLGTETSKWCRHFAFGLCLVLLLIAAGAALVAWKSDYSERLRSGIQYLVTHRPQQLTTSRALSHLQWSNAKLLAVVALILSTLGASTKYAIEKQDEGFGVPFLVFTLLILVALFDAALDLEAEWTITILANIQQSSGTSTDPVRLPEAIWRTNQFRVPQQAVVNAVRTGTVPSSFGFRQFTGTAQNLVAFATVITLAAILPIAARIIQAWQATLAPPLVDLLHRLTADPKATSLSAVAIVAAFGNLWWAWR